MDKWTTRRLGIFGGSSDGFGDSHVGRDRLSHRILFGKPKIFAAAVPTNCAVRLAKLIKPTANLQPATIRINSSKFDHMRAVQVSA